jgi:hypothetical protein
MIRKIFLVSALLLSTIKLGISQIKIRGTVTSEKKNKKLEGLKIKVKNTETSATTDSLGNFEIEVPDYDAQLEIIKDDEIFIIENFTNEFNIELAEHTFYLNYLDYLDYQNYYNYYNYSDYYNYYNYSEYQNYSNYQNYYNYSYSDYSNSYNAYNYFNYYDYYTDYYSDYSNYYNYSAYYNYYDTFVSEKEEVEAGLLTAGEVNDFSKWDMWTDIADNDLVEYQNEWAIAPVNRYCVQIKDEEGKPVVNAKVELIDNKNDTIWSSISDNTGKAELWGNLFKEITQPDIKYKINIQYQDKNYKIKYPKKFHDGINFFTVSSICQSPKNVDISFVVDATGSMDDEIDYLSAELTDIMTKTKDSLDILSLNLSTVFYKSVGDDFVTKKSDFSGDFSKSVNFMKTIVADGGASPEAVESGLECAVNELSWREDALAKIIFIVLDEPPANSEDIIIRMQNVIKATSKKGIRIVPVVCSGTDKSTEYLMRAIALATNGTYVFLTDDSGIGYSHIKPTTDEYDVEIFNDVILRLINQYTKQPDCNNILTYDKSEIKDTTIIIEPVLKTDSAIVENDIVPNIEKVDKKLLVYPNPTTGNLKIEISGIVPELYLADFSGKILRKFEVGNEEFLELYIGDFPSGIYFIQYQKDDEWMAAKIIMIK